MRLVTWNCCSGTIATLLKQLARLKADVLVLQEVAQPEGGPVAPRLRVRGPAFERPLEPPQSALTTLWRGTSARKGVAIVCRMPGLTLTAADTPPDLAPHSAAAVVHTREPFLLVNLWAHPRPSYADDAIATIRAWRARAPGLPLVVAGDFNVELRVPLATAQHRRLGQCLHDECGLVSAYHAHHGVDYGADGAPPTYRHLRNPRRTWHIDYCFVPKAWTSRIRSAAVVDGRVWRTRSDHSPVVAEWEDWRGNRA